MADDPPAQEPAEPTFQGGFADLAMHLDPDVIGQPVEREHPDPNGTGDTVQRTTTGLVRYHVGEVPVFFDGDTRVTWQPDRGRIVWHGDSWAVPPPEPTYVAASLPPSSGYSLDVRVTHYVLGGKMANGKPVHAGAVACSSNIRMGSTVVFPSGARFLCEDTGNLGSVGWIDVWGTGAYDGRATVTVYPP